MLSTHDVVRLALGEQASQKVDPAIPQDVFNEMSAPEVRNIAGWWYPNDSPILGQLLTLSECWRRIHEKLQRSELHVIMHDQDITTQARDWACLRAHAERGEVALFTTAELEGLHG